MTRAARLFEILDIDAESARPLHHSDPERDSISYRSTVSDKQRAKEIAREFDLLPGAVHRIVSQLGLDALEKARRQVDAS